MKHQLSFTTSAFQTSPQGSTSNAVAQQRPRSTKMDALVKRVNSSQRFSFEAAASAVNEAMKKAKARA